MRTRTAGVIALLAIFGVAGCGGPARPPGGLEPIGPVTVLAAASLTEAFTRVAGRFESAHPGVAVTVSFGGSSTLAQQILQGARADVFAAASPATMRPVVGAGLVDGKPAVFARNQLVIAVSKGNPKKITGLADLARPDVSVAVCAPQVPCGAAAATVLRAARVSVRPVTLEQDVKATLTKLTLGEVDAALVYRTDVIHIRADVDGVEFPESSMAINDYPLAVLTDAPNPVAAEAFADFVRSGPARTILAEAGFQVP